ncbi:hypothetical protein C8R44DRAFT_812011 [Mycena epipterygia]|nr:hypothetical protein C8R44DRAFT_812011 [Mycena epipterygia]
MDSAVRLTLTRDWDLSAFYPVVQQTKSIPGGDTVEWQVRVHPDGTLTHHRARCGVSILGGALLVPSFLKHTHVALRFVSQAAYERAAHLEITLAPDVVTRVFMIFKGVAELEAVAGEWNEQVGPGDPALLGM